MADAALRRVWSAVRQDFNRARAMLPDKPAESEGSVAQLIDWLDQNELGLALDELEALGEVNSVPPEFWQALASAAERMGLMGHRQRLTQRSLGQQT